MRYNGLGKIIHYRGYLIRYQLALLRCKAMKTFLRRMKTHPSILISLLVIVLALIEILPPPYSVIGNLVVAVFSVVALALGIREAQRDERATEVQIKQVHSETLKGRHEQELKKLETLKRGVKFPDDTPEK